jgi:hypothetical protein
LVASLATTCSVAPPSLPRLTAARSTAAAAPDFGMGATEAEHGGGAPAGIGRLGEGSMMVEHGCSMSEGAANGNSADEEKAPPWGRT